MPTEPIDLETLQHIVGMQGGVIVMLLDQLIESGVLSEAQVLDRVSKIYEVYADRCPAAAHELQTMLALLRTAPDRNRNPPRTTG